MKYDCSYCDKIINSEDKEQMEFCTSHNHDMLPLPESSSPKKESNTSQKIYRFVKSKIAKLIVSAADANQVYALIQNNNHVETLDLNGSKAKSWLRYSYFKENQENHSEESYTNALNLLKAEAIHTGSSRETIHSRIAMTEDAIYHDLCNDDWEAVKVTSNSVEIVTLDEKSPIFVRNQSQKSQVLPKFGSTTALEELCSLLRIPQKDRLVFKVHLVSMIIESYPIPIMSIVGEHGSIKSTISKSVKQIVDPAVAATVSLVNNSENLILSLYNRYAVCFDNVSKIDQITSDILCRAITGEGYSKRKLYSDSDEIIYNYKRKIILNGISPSIEFPDLIDRNITYTTDKVPENERITEEEFGKKYNELLPYALGQIFETLSKAMSLYPDVKLNLRKLPRMADFTIWGESISRAMGMEPLSFYNLYKERISQHSVDILESYPIISLIADLLNEKDHYEKSVNDFYLDLKILAETNNIDIDSKYVNYPKAANKIREHIQRLKPNIREMGFEVYLVPYRKTDGRHKKNRQVIYIERIKNTLFQEQDSLSLPSLPDLPPKKPEYYAQIHKLSGNDRQKEPEIITKEALPLSQLSGSQFNPSKDRKHGKDTLFPKGLDEEQIPLELYENFYDEKIGGE